MGAFEDSLTDLVLQKYDSLPTKSKPAIDPSSGLSSTWVPLSGLVVTRGKQKNSSITLDYVAKMHLKARRFDIMSIL